MLIRALQSAALAQTNYIEDVFSTYLYTGNGSTQTITNGIDLSTKGGLVWIKSRNQAYNHILTDSAGTLFGASGGYLSSNTTTGKTSTNVLSATSSGFTLTNAGFWNGTTSETYVSWTWAKQSKFFDVVTYTGTGSARTVSHSLGAVPGCMIVKATDSTVGWAVYHRSLGNGKFLRLDLTQGETTSSAYWNNTDPTSTQFTVGTDPRVNDSGITYVAYLFAHDAGGFGDSGTDNVISCGSFTTDGSGNATVNLGYEPQWLLTKVTDASDNWMLMDQMRGFTASNSYARLVPNLANAEGTSIPGYSVTSSGFTVAQGSGPFTYIYIAIRRGPMRKPTSGTGVFLPTAFSGNGGSGSYSNGFPTDLVIHNTRNTAGLSHFVYDRLRGRSPRLFTDTSGAEVASAFYDFDKQNDLSYSGNASGFNATGETYVDFNFRRAPGFFDVVCYTGTGANRTVSHNLGVVPELMIVKDRTTAQNWPVYCAYLGGANPANRYVLLNSSNSFGGTSVYWNDTAPTSSVFTVGTTASTNNSGDNFVAYLFATCPGVSKVGSYTGTGATLQIDCGFAAGARFVLIKRTDSTGDWYVWDSARGIVAGNDPYLLLNSTAAEVTTTDWVDTYSLGFELSNAGGNNVNINTASYIYLAIA